MNDNRHHRTSAANCRNNPGVSTSGNHCYVCEPADAAPAPLDPAAVKAGDTVTLESGTALVRDVVIESKSRGVGQFVFYTAENPDPLIPGAYYLVNPGAWTLTDHQPAPEPEPEWAMGQVAAIEVDGDMQYRAIKGDVSDLWHTETGDTYGHGEVTDVRPLFVIDPEHARALVHDHFDDDRSRALLDALLDL